MVRLLGIDISGILLYYFSNEISFDFSNIFFSFQELAIKMIEIELVSFWWVGSKLLPESSHGLTRYVYNIHMFIMVMLLIKLSRSIIFMNLYFLFKYQKSISHLVLSIMISYDGIIFILLWSINQPYLVRIYLKSIFDRNPMWRIFVMKWFFYALTVVNLFSSALSMTLIYTMNTLKAIV